MEDFSRQEMLDATTKWISPGKEPDFYSCGKGDALSEQPAKNKAVMEDLKGTAGEKEKTDTTSHEASQKRDSESGNKDIIDRANQKKLRGSMIEDIREMLDVARKERRDTVVGWLVHGRAFKIYNKELFVKDFLPRFSKVTKFENFADALRPCK